MERKMMDCGSWFLWILGLGIILAMVGSRCVHATITCSEAISTLATCVPFLTGASPSPSAPCCEGVSKLNDEASTTKDRQVLCNCLKATAPSVGVNPERARELAPMCSVNTPVPIDPDTNCNNITMQRGMK
ncbi:hypothetical protein SLEP1_g25733 [Rubroshorea leprosula]|uniref:Non-specific lipid-transfer protein n=1 Tax=Rubroshorea leprosula TaxID=152421 RepID=A0AAV5JUE4_9ROSI|nr:hypothetical protein SLEP1_g25733 [Rubroshorea leprosula]